MSAKQLLQRERERKKTKRRERDRRRSRRILRLPEVEQRTGKKHASIYADIAKGVFPAPVPLGPRAVGWLEDEIDDWLEARIAERDNGTAVRSLPLAGLNQRRKIEASPQDVRPPQDDVRDRWEARRVRRGGGQRETPQRVDPLRHDACRGNRGIGK
jgi:prophage regulatory protein